MVYTGSIPVVTSNIKLLTMQYILTCPNGKQIDMTRDVLDQLERKIERQEVLERINYYKSTNKWESLHTKLY